MEVGVWMGVDEVQKAQVSGKYVNNRWRVKEREHRFSQSKWVCTGLRGDSYPDEKVQLMGVKKLGLS